MRNIKVRYIKVKQRITKADSFKGIGARNDQNFLGEPITGQINGTSYLKFDKRDALVDNAAEQCGGSYA